MPMLWSQPMMLPRWWGVRICIEVGLEGGCRWMRRLEGGCTRGWRARSPGTSGRMARALNILRVFMVRVWKDECVVLLKQGAFKVLSKWHLLCAKTRSWSFRAAWSGLKVQIVKRKADYWPPHQSLDFTILVSPMPSPKFQLMCNKFLVNWSKIVTNLQDLGRKKLKYKRYSKKSLTTTIIS